MSERIFNVSRSTKTGKTVNAENPYNSDYHRVLFNVLLVITGFECF